MRAGSRDTDREDRVRVLLAISVLLLAACSTPRDRIVTRVKEVRVPVTVPCNAKIPPEVPGPDFASEDSDILKAAKHVAKQMLRLRQTEQELRRSLELCARTGSRRPDPR